MRDDEDEEWMSTQTKKWCDTIFPTFRHNDLQIGVVDYLLHGLGGDENMDQWIPHIIELVNKAAAVPHICSQTRINGNVQRETTGGSHCKCYP